MRVVMMVGGNKSVLGGETRVAVEISEAMSKKAEVVLICTGVRNQVRKEKQVIEVTIKSTTSLEDANEIPVFSASTVKFLIDFLDEYKPDIIHSHSVYGAPFLGQIWAKMNSVPYFYTTHEIPSKMASWFEINDSSFLAKLVNSGVIKEYFLTFLNNCTGVIALNNEAKREVEGYGYKGDIYVIPNGRFLKDFNKLKIPDIDKKEKILTFVGSVSIRKNQIFLINMMKYLPKEYRLLLPGRFFMPQYRKKIEGLAKRSGKVRVLGPIQPEEVAEILEKSHLFVSASKAEVQALSVIEALASGTPVVGLSNETIDEIVNGSNGKWLPKNCSEKRFAIEVKKILTLRKDRYIE